MGAEFDSLKQAVVEASNFLVRSGALSLSNHGNFSVRVPGTDTVLLTGTSSLVNLKPENLALLDLEGNIVEGEINPTNAEIIHMHTVVYKHRPNAGAVVHTHSPYTTMWAIASRPIECAYEALVRSEMTDGVPVAHYGPRGSAMAIANIAAALAGSPNTRAVLLENHGLLAWGGDAAMAARTVTTVEEAAQMGLGAEALGGSKLIPPELRKATLERRDEFARAGTQRA